MARGKAISEEAREIIYKVYLFCAAEAENFATDDGYFLKVQQRVSCATGVSLKFIYLLLKEKGKFRSDAHHKRIEQEKSLKRKKGCDESNENISDECQNKLGIESVKPGKTKINVKRIQKKSLLETVLTTPNHTESRNSDTLITVAGSTARTFQPVSVTAGPSPMSNRPIAFTTSSTVATAGPSIMTVAQINEKAERMLASATTLATKSKAINTKSSLKQLQQNDKDNAFIKVHPIPISAVPKKVLVNVPNKKTGPSFIKVYPIPKDLVPKDILENAQNKQKQNIEFKTVPIEFDPGSFKIDIKIESDFSTSD